METILKEGLAQLGLDTGSIPALTEFSRRLLEKNQVMNLTAITEPADVARLHLLDCACLLTACILLFGENLMRLFTSTEEVVRLGMRMMRIIATGYIAMAVTQVLSGVMRGAGDTMTPMWISLFTTVILRVPVAYVWAFLTRSPELPSGSSDALFFSLLISWVMGAVVTTFFFQRGKWRTKAITGNAAKNAEA